MSIYKEGILSYLEYQNSRFYRHPIVTKTIWNIDSQVTLALAVPCPTLGSQFIGMKVYTECRTTTSNSLQRPEPCPKVHINTA
jgi:hypothetical protein